jgi:hypothetical protein
MRKRKKLNYFETVTVITVATFWASSMCQVCCYYFSFFLLSFT